jgi:hypothetical protein
MTTLSPYFSTFEGMQTTLSVAPKDPPNTPVPRLVHVANVPDADQLEQLLVKAIGRVNSFDGAAEAVCSVGPGSSSAAGECMLPDLILILTPS